MRLNSTRHLVVILLAVAAVLGPVGVCRGQAAGSAEREVDWQASYFNGFFTGGPWLTTETILEGETVLFETNAGWLTGVRLSADQEETGLEFTLAAVFADMDLRTDPAAGLPDSVDSTLILAGVNGLWYPTGNQLADGRIRPFMTFGPGVVYLNSDLGGVANELAVRPDDKLMFDVNFGLGMKFLLGETGNPVARLDYRWYYIFGDTAGLQKDIYRQELSLGIGIRF